MAIEIIDMLIPKSNKNTRPGTIRNPRTITIHDTGNDQPRANALAHARLQFLGNTRKASWHYQVDDESQVYRSVPDNEVAYAAGDGSGPGNSYSIHIETCINKDGNFLKAVHNTAELVQYLLLKYPSIKHIDVVQHNKWSGKDCPRQLRSGLRGIDWSGFMKLVREEDKPTVETPKAPVYTTTNNNFKIGQKVRVKKTAKTYATGESIPSFVKGSTDEIQQRGSNRMLLKGIYSWVKTSDLEIIEDKPSVVPSKKEETTQKPSSSIYKGSSIVDYLNSIGEDSSMANRRKLASKYGIKGYSGQSHQNTLLLGYLRDDVKKPAAPKTYKANQKVKIKTSAKTYSRTTVQIPAKFKNKNYTIQQVSKDDVLIKELYSWVKKTDLA